MSIAVLGGYGVGITMQLARMPHAGETVSGGVLTREHGGKGSNQAIAIARWGSRPTLITAIGDDADGRAARELWSREGVDDAAVITVDDATMAGVILVDGEGENRIAIAAGALDALWGARVEPLAATALEGASALVISLEVPHDAAMRCCDAARRAGIPVILNPAPATDVPRELWTTADILVPNQTEARSLLGLEAVDLDDLAIAVALAEHCSGDIILTCGAEGAIVVDNGSVSRITSPSAVVVDTTGAGDTFVGVFAAEYSAGAELNDAVTIACRAAAFSVEHRGVIAGIPRRDELAGAAA
ncbi:ribokinase [Microcella sp.]|uniref:ribokinase n=1 Tax=Microcella sp. TaxID=1913979 RepID=UPI0025684DD2|nr:ribokinase [Microcella sp.]MBX9471120.1 ribokinase [Microcella sp.]